MLGFVPTFIKTNTPYTVFTYVHHIYNRRVSLKTFVVTPAAAESCFSISQHSGNNCINRSSKPNIH